MTVAFAVFDVETRIDKQLLNRVFFAGENLSDQEACDRFREQLMRRNSDFVPVALHVPISIAVGSVGDDHILRSVESLALADYSEERLVRELWTRAERFTGCLVSFNGRRFDLPVLELQALRYGISAPNHFSDTGAARSRYSEARHLDLFDFITNYGAFSIRGGLDLLLKLIGMPGKVGMAGAQVQALYEAGQLDEIHRYCRSDVIQTYFLFIRVQLMRGRIDEAGYRAAYDASAHFLDQLGARAPGSQL
ncbi:MAG: ribonuclease H-like domain-containing protein [Candidatus Binataceae bacterium]